ncbi:Na+/H+ antiporter NhaA [Sesbania bispinosa]|nr:Na+/H+ antiporter NhaA [Sesbania bispinosa]
MAMRTRRMGSYTQNHISRPPLPPPPRTTSRRATPEGSFHNDILRSNGIEHGLTLLPSNHMSKSNNEIDNPVLDDHISHMMPS